MKVKTVKGRQVIGALENCEDCTKYKTFFPHQYLQCMAISVFQQSLIFCTSAL